MPSILHQAWHTSAIGIIGEWVKDATERNHRTLWGYLQIQKDLVETGRASCFLEQERSDCAATEMLQAL